MQKGMTMPTVLPFHSTRQTNALAGLLAGAPHQPVYHNNSLCTEGNNIERMYWAPGTANRPLCKRCIELGMQGR